MDNIFLKLVHMSITASWLVLAVLLLRLLLKKAPKWISCLLWVLVAVRLISPLSIESEFSLIPDSVSSGKMISEWTDDYIGKVSILNEDSEYYDAAVTAGREPISDGKGGYYVVTNSDQLGEPSTIRNTVIPVLSWIWAIGAGLMLLYVGVSCLRLHRRLKTAVLLRDNIYQSENVFSPFVFGFFRPRIYLPFNTKDIAYVIAHEQTHIRRHDHWVKPFGFLLLSLYWFNPVIWAAYILLCRDIELACDERVIRELGVAHRADYSQALLNCSTPHRAITACPLAFGEVGVRERVKNVLNYRKPAFWIVTAAVLSCIVLAVCFLTNPERMKLEDIASEDGYTLAEQKRYDFTLSIPKEKLTETIYTAGGQTFEKDEVIVYQTDTTDIYLECVMPSNETEEELYLIFNFSYRLPESGKILVPHQKKDNGLFGCVGFRNETVYTETEEYPDALALRGHGPAEQFAFYLSTDVCRSAEGTMMIDAFCSEWTYYSNKEGERTQNKSISAVGGVDEPQYIETDAEGTAIFDKAVSAAILEQNGSDTPDGLIRVESHIIFDTAEVSGTPAVGNGEHKNTMTVYALVLYQEYSVQDGGLTEVGGSHIPTALTFDIDAEKNFTLTEYWVPRDGSYYDSDIRDKFPENAANQALDSKRYLEQQWEECLDKAEVYLSKIKAE